MPTTSLGIAYPSLTDAPEGPAQMQALAEDVDGLIAADRTARDGAWTQYTPDITGSAGGTWTKGTATVSCYYTRIGRTVIVNGEIIWGSTTSVGTISGSWLIALPVTARAAVPLTVGAGVAQDASPTARQVLAVNLNSTTHMFFVIGTTGSTVQNTTPWTWAQSDILGFQATYEAASAP